MEIAAQTPGTGWIMKKIQSNMSFAAIAGASRVFPSDYRRMRRNLELYLPHTSLATSTASFSFAHCSSSVRRLPSSVEAKPHCGDNAS
jgi:hypothetical protein